MWHRLAKGMLVNGQTWTVRLALQHKHSRITSVQCLTTTITPPNRCPLMPAPISVADITNLTLQVPPYTDLQLMTSCASVAQLLELIRTRTGDPEVVSLASPALAAVLRTWPSQTAATFAKTRLLDLLSAAVDQQRRMHADQVRGHSTPAHLSIQDVKCFALSLG